MEVNIYYLDSNTSSSLSGFHCVPDFVPHFKQWSIDNEAKHRSRGGLVNVPETDPIREQIQQIHLRRGSFLVWDSRTPHGQFNEFCFLFSILNDTFRLM